MSKVVISEERLSTIIRQSIMEAIEDEGLGTKIAQGLGNARQWVQNKVDNYRNAFNAGRNQQRFANKDYDPYQGMKDADQIRNFGGDEYGQYRYNVTADRNNRAAQQWKNGYGTTTNKRPSANGERMPNYFDGQGGQSGQVNGPEPQEKLANTSAQTQSAQTQRNEQQPVQKKGGFQAKQARPIADIQAQVTNGRVMSKADGQLVSAALGEYKKNHPEINERIIKEAVAKAVRKYMSKQNK